MKNSNYELSIYDIPINIAIYEPTDDEDFIFVEFNKRAELTEKISRDELIGKKLTEMFPGVKSMGLFDVLLRVSKTGKEELFNIGLYEDNRMSGWRKNKVSKLDNGLIFVAYDDVDDKDIEVETYGKQLNARIKEIEELKEQNELALLGNHDGVWDWNILDGTVYFSPRYKEMIGYSEDELVNNFSTWEERVHPDDIKSAMSFIQENIEQKTDYYENTHRLKHKDGSWVWILARGKAVFDKDGKAVRMIGTHTDVTAEKEVQILLQKSNNLLKKLSDNIPGTIYQYRLYPDGRTSFPYASVGIEDIYEVTPDNVINDVQSVFDVLHPDDLNMIADSIQKSAETLQEWNLEYRVILPKKGLRWLMGQAQPEKLEDGSILWHGFIYDITEKKNTEDEIKEQKHILFYQAHHDALTELPNRVLFNDRLEQAIEKAKRNNTKIAILFIDLDHFKDINDSLGHTVGDEILKTITSKLTETIRGEDTVARLGGDEFAVILEDLTQIQDASTIATKLLKVLSREINIDDNTLYVSSSIGISIYPDDGKSAQNLLKFADSAMYKAKDEGRNNFQYYNSTMTELAFERVVMEASLRSALKNEEFVVYYQPQVDGNTNKLIGMEALVRWQHPTMGLVSPAKFIPLAETTGLIVELDRLVMKIAMTQITQWYKDGLNPGVLTINLAVKQLQQTDFIEMIENLLKEIECKAKWIELEVTESQIMTNPDEAIKLLTQISDLGIELAVDDFGTGYSSLAYLKRLPINKLKIDQAFIRNLPDDDEDSAITKAVIALAKSLNLKVIAEGVETKEQKDFLVENGCKNIQGYYYSKPVPEDEIKTILVDGFNVVKDKIRD